MKRASAGAAGCNFLGKQKDMARVSLHGVPFFPFFLSPASTLNVIVSGKVASVETLHSGSRHVQQIKP